MKRFISLSDTRAQYRRIVGELQFRSGVAFLKVLITLAASVLIASIPEFPGLSDAGRWSLGIAVFAGLLWMTEAIPAFAVALLVIGLQIVILGRPGGVMMAAGDERGWEAFVDPWASPPMWLFFGGFVLARAAARSGLDRTLAESLLAVAGVKPERVLLVAMLTSFVFSMFLSNTATAAMMLAVLAPMLAGNTSPGAAKTLIVGVAFSANLGGMGTIIGTPPNAIASALLVGERPVDFLGWMVFGLPPAAVLLLGLYFFLRRAVKGSQFQVSGDAPPLAPASQEVGPLPGESEAPTNGVDPVARWQVLVVFGVVIGTIGLWLTGAWHGLPTAVVSFVPIVALSITGVIRAEDIRSLDWDILILLAGGLSLGVGVSESGLASWIAGELENLAVPTWVLATCFAFLTLVLSNVMSNTAASNILIPIGLAAGLSAGGGREAVAFAVPMALAASAAMVLPISTPPNAIAYASGRLSARDFLLPGVLIGLVAVPLCVVWVRLVLMWTA